MKKYSVMLRGENFEVNLEEGGVENLGFITTRVVKADSLDEAEQMAVNLVKNDQSLIKVMRTCSQHEPTIYLESISKASFFQRVGGEGYSFYPMDSE